MSLRLYPLLRPERACSVTGEIAILRAKFPQLVAQIQRSELLVLRKTLRFASQEGQRLFALKKVSKGKKRRTGSFRSDLN